MRISHLPIVVTFPFMLCINGGTAARAGSQASNAPATSSAVVKGTVKFAGDAPKPVHIDMSADPKCVQLRPGGGATEDIVTDRSGGLENAVVYVSDGLGNQTFQPPQEAAEIVQKGCMYQPHVVALQANQKLNVVNADTTTHNIHPVPNNNRELNQTQPSGLPLSMTFAREEVAIPVKCNIHPWMRSYIAVFKHPYFAVTDKNGNFELNNLPPGTYTIKAWHEKLGMAIQKVAVNASETKMVEFVFKPQ